MKQAFSGPFLAFQLKHIGDVLMTLPALGLLKHHFPQEKIGLVVTPQTAPLVAEHPWVNEHFILKRSRNFSDFYHSCQAIKAGGFETAFIFDGQLRSILAAKLSKIKNPLADSGLYPLKGPKFLYRQNLDTVTVSPANQNILNAAPSPASQALTGQKMVAKAMGLALAPDLKPPPPPIKPANIQCAKSLLGELGASGPRIGLALTGLQPEKSWPMVSFAALCQMLYHNLSANIFITGSVADKGQGAALATLAKVPMANFCGRTSLIDLVALDKEADLFITVDTGTAHLVALTETPLITLFIWTNPAQWAPKTPNLSLLCYNWALQRFNLGNKNGPWHNAPVITPEMVFQQACSLLP
ncbi:MAG: glycosyltransferase family 9 protein [Candidatus Adiutrix sp.]